MLVRELARVLNGIPGDFQIWVDGIQVHFGQKLVELDMVPKAEPPSIERFSPNLIGMSDDNSEFGNNTTPRVDLSYPDKQKQEFYPNEAGWTEENEFYYQKWKNGGNDLTYLQELEEIDRLKKKDIGKDDIGSNTIHTNE